MSKEEILKKMKEIMPWVLDKVIEPYIYEAMELYASEFHKLETTKHLLNQKDRAHYVDVVRGYLKQYNNEEISFSKFVELLNSDANSFAFSVASRSLAKASQNSEMIWNEKDGNSVVKKIIYVGADTIVVNKQSITDESNIQL